MGQDNRQMECKEAAPTGGCGTRSYLSKEVVRQSANIKEGGLW